MSIFFFFNDTATTEIYTLSLHDALPIWDFNAPIQTTSKLAFCQHWSQLVCTKRSEEHTSELQSPCNLVCRLLLEKKKKKFRYHFLTICLSSRQSVSCLSSFRIYYSCFVT